MSDYLAVNIGVFSVGSYKDRVRWQVIWMLAMEQPVGSLPSLMLNVSRKVNGMYLLSKVRRIRMRFVGAFQPCLLLIQFFTLC